MDKVFLLLVLFEAKHFLADFILQTKWMLNKFKPDWGFFLPLLAHSGVNALFTLFICLVFASHLWWLALFDLCTHFVMDRIKASPKYLGRFELLAPFQIKNLIKSLDDNLDPTIVYHCKRKLGHNMYFWWSLGLDQMFHRLVHIAIIFVMIGF